MGLAGRAALGMFVLHVHDRWSSLGGADWHLISILDSWPDHARVAGVFGRRDGSVSVSPDINTPPLFFIKKLDKKAPFSGEARVGGLLSELIDQQKPDLIHVHNILNPYLMERLAESGRALITVQDHRFFCPGRGKVRADGTLCDRPMGLTCSECFDDEPYFLKVLELVRARLSALHGFRAIIVLSRYMKRQLAQAGLPDENIHVIPPFVHGLDQTYSPAAFGREILFAGRVVRSKGVFDLLEAMALADHSAKLIIAGAGTVDGEVEDQVRGLGLENRVTFLGWTQHSEMAAVYRRARLVVMPSLWQEPFGIVGLEAQALGRPAAAYEVGGVSDWLEDSVTGLLIPHGNILALASCINVLTKEPQLASELGRAARERTAKGFNRVVLMDRLFELYESLVF